MCEKGGKIVKKRRSKLLLAAVLTLVLMLGVSMSTYAEESGDSAPATEEQMTAPEGEMPEGEAPAGDDAGGMPELPEGMEMPEGFDPDMMMGDQETAGWEVDTTEVADTASTFQTIATVAVVAVGVIVVLLAVLLVLGINKRKKNPEKTGMKRGIFNTLVAGGMAVIMVVLCVANYLTHVTYKNSVDALFTKSAKADSDIETDAEDWQNLCFEIAGEGMVLMRNENNTLPLDTSSENVKINLLGYRAYEPVYSGSGSGSVDSGTAIDIVTSLESAGFEVNPACTDEGVYVQEKQESKGIGFMGASFAIDEVSLDKYTGEASFDKMKEYSDIAVVVIGRTGGEGSDLTAFEGEEGKTYLQLSSEEEALLQKARETFGTLIVIYNAANAMEMGYLEEYGVDACIWAGIPGPKGFAVLGELLNGNINPSGKLVDTWAYDLNSNPVHENYADQAADNTDGYYVDYVEGIYMGYKWYETAYAENAVITNTRTGDTYDYSDYDSIVQYPFGYGLSYTTFEHKIINIESDGSSLDPTGNVTVQVEVTNTGNVAGKDAVEIYLTAPYTDYDKEHGVEKSAVSLAGYGKTGEIQPGETETVDVTFSVESIASYDSSYDNGDGTKGAYMLDEGDYIFSARSDSHNVYDETTLTLSKQHFYSGEDKRESDDQAAYNQFDDVARGIYLSRQDGFANYEEAMNSVSTSVKDTSFDENPGAYDTAKYDDIITKEYVEGVDYSADGNLTLADMKGLSYEDEKWDELISQLSIEDITSIITQSIYGTPEVEAVGKVKMTDTDGPLGISSLFNKGQNSVAFPSLPLLAATFNNDLARKYGNYIADQAHSLGVSGWYAPAMNMHRSPYSGRNFEYYSEDAVLSAGIGSNETLGAREKGLVVYLKHFALNDMESNRSGQLHTYSNEQAIREIYLRPFEDSVKYGGATGIMSSMNYIGDVYTTASEALCTEVLRNEWGFRGAILTDVAEGSYATDCADAAIRAGTDFWLAMGAFDVSAESNADIYYLQRVAKDILYMCANAQVVKAEVVNWQMYLYILDAELIILFALGAAALVMKNRKKKTAAVEKAE